MVRLPVPDETKSLRVAADTAPNALAGALTPRIKADGCVFMDFMGEGAMTNAMAALVISRGHLAQEGLDLVVVPQFRAVQEKGEDRKGYRLVVWRVPGGIHAALLEAPN